ncbi:MAG: hypothetical protein ACK56W_05190 [Pirellula sp.]|nr:hypothetical protein [Pirellula sp.]
MRCWFLANLMILILNLGGYAQEIKIVDIIAVWKRTPIAEVQVGFESRGIETKLTSNAQMKAQVDAVGQTESSSQVAKGRFCRNNVVGMRKSSAEREWNWIGGRGGLSVDRVSLKTEGIFGVVAEADREATIVTLQDVELMMAWLDPLATTMFSRIKPDDELDLRCFQDPAIGSVVQMEIRGERTFEMVLAKKFDWRPIEAREFLGNKLVSQSEWNYQVNDQKRIELVDATQTSFRGLVTSECRIQLESVQYECPEDRISIALEGEYVLFEDSGKGKTYVVLKDGTKHVLTDEMRRGRKSWTEIFAWVRESSPKAATK